LTYANRNFRKLIAFGKIRRFLQQNKDLSRYFLHNFIYDPETKIFVFLEK